MEKKQNIKNYLTFTTRILFLWEKCFHSQIQSFGRVIDVFIFPNHSYLSLSSMPHWWHVFVDISIAFWYVVHSWVSLRIKRPFSFHWFILPSRGHGLLEEIGLRRASIEIILEYHPSANALQMQSLDVTQMQSVCLMRVLGFGSRVWSFAWCEL